MDERGTIDGGRHAGTPDVAPEDEDRIEDADPTTTDADGPRVGLGRVVDDRLPGRDPDADDARRREAPATPDVTEESEQSFPASDPPSFAGTTATDPPGTR